MLSQLVLLLAIIIPFFVIIHSTSRSSSTSPPPSPSPPDPAALPAPSHPQTPFLLAIPTGISIFSHIRQGNVLQYTTPWFLRYPSRTFSLRLFSLRQVWTSSPQNIEHVLSTASDFEHGNDQVGAFRSFLGRGLFGTNGEEWRERRGELRSRFRMGSEGKSMMWGLEGNWRRLEGEIRREMRENGVVELQEIFARLTIDVSELAFGRPVGALGAKKLYEKREQVYGKGAGVAQALIYISRIIALRFLLGPLGWLHRGAKATRAKEVLDEYLDASVTNALAEYADVKESEDKNEEKRVFIKELIKTTRDPRVLRDQLATVLAAGTDTTAALLSFIIYNLVRNDDVFDKLRKEVEELEGEIPDSTQLKQMTYLRWVVDESMFHLPLCPFCLLYSLLQLMPSQLFDYTL